MQRLDGAFQEGDQLQAIVGPRDGERDGTYARVGQHGVTEIRVAKAAGPMGWYAVAEVFCGDTLARKHPMHMLDTVVVADV